MLAGGCVRDRLFGREPKDYDLATAASPQFAMDFFEQRGYKVVATGLQHGTISVVTELQTLEITTLRTDVACDGRRAEVSFSTSFEEDARRRDFTINALFEDADGKVHDHVGGLADFENRRLRFVGDAGGRIREDYLRILRYFRFLGRYGWSAEPDQLTAVTENLEGLKLLSAERVQSEMEQILGSAHVASVLPLLVDSGLTGTLFPFVQRERIPALVALLQQTPDDDLRWFSFYFWSGGQPAEPEKLKRFLGSMRFSRKRVKLLQGLAQLFHTCDSTVAYLERILHMHEQQILTADRLAAYLKPCRDFFDLRTPKLTDTLLEGLQKHPPAPIHRPTLMDLEPSQRGAAVRLVKIYWYLSRCHDKDGVIAVMRKMDSYRRQLNSTA